MPGPSTGGAMAPVGRLDRAPPPAGGQAGDAGMGGDTPSRVDAMRRHLVATRPSSGNEALRILRAAFPFAPLAERVEAANGIDRYAF